MNNITSETRTPDLICLAIRLRRSYHPVKLRTIDEQAIPHSDVAPSDDLLEPSFTSNDRSPITV